MEKFSIEELADRVGGRYALVVAAAKRARQLNEGAVPLVKVDSPNFLTIALAEIHAGKVIVKPPGEAGDEPEILPGARQKETQPDEDDLLGKSLFSFDTDDVGEDVVGEEDTEEDEEYEEDDLDDEEAEELESEL